MQMQMTHGIGQTKQIHRKFSKENKFSDESGLFIKLCVHCTTHLQSKSSFCARLRIQSRKNIVYLLLFTIFPIVNPMIKIVFFLFVCTQIHD